MSRSYPIRVANQAVRFPPRARRLLLIGIDALLLPLAVWLSFWLLLAHPFHSNFLAAGKDSVARAQRLHGDKKDKQAAIMMDHALALGRLGL